MNTLAYFWAENARQSFTRAEILLYLYLNQNVDTAGSLCHSTAQLAAALHLCSGTILRARKSLAARGLLTLTKSGTKTTYCLLPQRGQNRVAVGERSVTHGIDGLSNPSRFIGDTFSDDVLGQSLDGVDQPYSTPDRVENGDDGPSVARRVLNPTDYGHTALSLDYPHGGITTPDLSDSSDLSDLSDSPRTTNPEQHPTSNPLLSPSWQARISRNMHIAPERLAAAVDDYLATAPPLEQRTTNNEQLSHILRTQFLRWFNRRRRRF